MGEKSLLLNCVNGINQQLETAGPTQCSDARNVWERNGRVVERPGYKGVMRLTNDPISQMEVPKELVYQAPLAFGYDSSIPAWISPAGGVLTLSGLKAQTGADGDWWYLGFTAKFDVALVKIGLRNTNKTLASAFYWNGTGWSTVMTSQAVPHLSDASGYYTTIRLVSPRDWASSAVNSVTAYWLKFVLLNADLGA
jgi:hypothetical protein